jgi:hypothetical protein
MHRLTDSRTVPPGELPDAARELRAGGWRFVTATCIPRPAGWTVLYHFERHERLCHLRVELGRAERMPAIDDAYPGAFLVENEMSELQGLPVSDLSIDYGGRLFRDFDGPEGWIRADSPGAGGAAAPPPAEERGV